MKSDRDTLPEDLRALADRLEATADAEERVVARVHARLGRPALSTPVVVAVAAAVVLGAIGLRSILPPPDAGTPTLPQLVGIFRSVEAVDGDRCVAVRLYDTTPADGRVAIWTWTAQDGCDARSSNLATSQGRAEAVSLPAAQGRAPHAGILVETPAGVASPLAGLTLILDPLAASPSAGSVPGYRSLAEAGGGHTLELREVQELDVPYRPE